MEDLPIQGRMKVMDIVFQTDMTDEEYAAEVPDELQPLVFKYGAEKAEEFLNPENSFGPEDFASMFK